MDRDALADEIAAAARLSFAALLARHGDEDFYAFALYTDGDGWTVVPAANSREQFRATVEREGLEDPADLAAYRWSSAEWAYEAFAAEPFEPICATLRAASEARDDDEAAFAAFKDDLHHAMTEALRRLDREGFFGDRRDGAVLFVTSSDADEAPALEDRSAEALNPPDTAEAFRRRYEAGDEGDRGNDGDAGS